MSDSNMNVMGLLLSVFAILTDGQDAYSATDKYPLALLLLFLSQHDSYVQTILQMCTSPGHGSSPTVRRGLKKVEIRKRSSRVCSMVFDGGVTGGRSESVWCLILLYEKEDQIWQR